MIRCDAHGCIRGVVRSSAFGEPCQVCNGAGALSLSAIAKRIDENESTLRKILKPHRKMRVKVCQRICFKLVALTAPPKQSELFA